MLENLREVKDKLKKRSWHKAINVAVALAVVAMLEFTFLPQPQVVADPAGDFKVLRGTTVISAGNTAATITEETDYTLESGVTINDAFIRIVNCRLTGMGQTSGGGDQNQVDFSVRIDNPENLLTSITFTRIGSTNDCRVEWEIIQYIGSSGGANEIIVRGVGDVATSGTTATVDGATLTNIANVNKVCCFITGQAGANTESADWWEHLFTAAMVADDGDWKPRFTRGASGSNVGYISYAVVEFTGSNWKNVQRLEITTEATAWDATDYDNYTDVNIVAEGGSNLSDASKAFLHVQYRTDNDDTGLEDAGDHVQIISTTQLRIRNRSTDGTRTKVVWIMENTQSGTGAMSVEHIQFYDSTTSGDEERSWTHTITTVSSTESTSIMGECASVDGTGTAYPRGAINLRLTSTSQVTLTESDAGQERQITFDVVQWPEAPSGPSLGQNHYRWRNDSYGLDTDNGWQADEDNTYTSLAKETTARLRVEIANTGGGSADDYQYLLEYSTDTGGPWTTVPVTAASNEHFEMVDSAKYADADDITSGFLTATGTWANGKGVEDPSNKTANFSLTTAYYTEFEYAIQATTDATGGGTYYFRLTNDGSDLDTYTRYPEVTIFLAPIVDQVHYRWRNDDWSGTPAWGHTDYTHRKKITLTSDTGKIPSTQSNFPLLIDVTDANLRTTGDGGFVQNANGWDVMFTDSDGSTALDREMTDYTSSSSSANYSAWVRVPSLSTSKEIYMYYGKSGVSSDPSTPTTWDSNFKMVHHLQETSGTHEDSTANDNDGTCQGGVTQDATGQINGGDEFDGIDNYINCGSASSLDITGNTTLEAWVKKATPVKQNVAEWEPMQGVLIRYDGSIFDITYEVIKEMSEDVQIVSIVASSDGEQAEVETAFANNNVICNGNCIYLVAASNSEWTRDYGPWFIWSETDEYRIVDYEYNRPRADDNAIPGEYGSWQGINVDVMDLIHSGGNWMTDGHGIAVSTNLTWEENPTKSHAEIEQIVEDYLGIHTYYHVIPDALGAYIKHIDCFAKFLSPDTVMVVETDIADPQYDNLEEAAAYFANVNSCYGTHYNVYRVYVPGTDEDTYDEAYINSLILNNKVFVPILGDSEWDDDAITAYEAAMPGYEVIAVDDTGTGGRGWMNTDAMHCRARGIMSETPWDYDFIVSKGKDAYNLQMNRVGSTLHGYISENETPTTTSTPTDWHHYALTFNGTAQNLFIDGVSANTTAHVGAIGSNSENVTIGGSCVGYDPTSDDFFSGTIDEVRISNIPRTADWIKTSYSNQDNPSAFYTPASQESYPEGATWKTTEDTAITDQARFEDIRLRFSIKNTGGQASAYNYRLQVSDNETSGYTDVPAATGCGYAVACMTTSTYFADQTTTTNQLSVPDALAWTGGKMVEGDSNQSDAITIDNDEFTEVEFIFQFTSNAPGSTTYYFRVAKGGSSTPLDSYSENATITTESTPTWVSYSDDTHETVCEDFDVYETEHWVYMHGEGFTAEETYKVIYWDPLGTKRAVDSSVEAGPTGNLSSPHEFVFGDEPGDWHCTVYHPDTHDPESYSTTDPYIVADDTTYTGGYAYHMDAAAIPEFPTVISAIAVAGLCFGIYYWMRRRYRRVEVSRY